MVPDDPLLLQPATAAAPAIALRWLERIADAARRFCAHEDPEALHDLRVGLRRLRATARSYREVLEPALGKKPRRTLRELAQASNLARDTEVQLAWLEAHAGELRGGQRTGYHWLHRHLQARLLAEYAQLREKVQEELGALERRLRPRLAAVAEVPGPPMAVLVTGVLRPMTPSLADALTRLAESDDPERIHPPRLLAKRLRYLLDPFAPALPAVAEACRQLSALQDRLGQIHDRQVLLQMLQAESEAAGAWRFRLLLELSLREGGADTPELAHARRHNEVAGFIALARLARAQERQALQSLQAWAENRGAEQLQQRVGAAVEALAGTVPAAPAP